LQQLRLRKTCQLLRRYRLRSRSLEAEVGREHSDLCAGKACAARAALLLPPRVSSSVRLRVLTALRFVPRPQDPQACAHCARWALLATRGPWSSVESSTSLKIPLRLAAALPLLRARGDTYAWLRRGALCSSVVRRACSARLRLSSSTCVRNRSRSHQISWPPLCGATSAPAACDSRP
jgi:hypothetical protein